MKGKLSREILDDYRTESKALVRYIKDVLGKKSQELTDALNIEIASRLKKGKKKNAIDRWYNDEKTAPSKNEVVIIVEALRKIAGYPTNLTAEKKNAYGPPPIPDLVWVPFDMELPVTNYNGINPPLSFIQMKEKKGVVISRSTSKHEADGELIVGQTGTASEIEPGTRIAIKRINKAHWIPDRYYVIINASNQISICELLPGDDEKTVRLVSTKNPEGPHRVFLLEDIVVIFSIVDGNWPPTPPRKRGVFSNSQQQDIPPTDSQ